MAGLPSLPPTGPLAYELGRRMFLKIAATLTAGVSVGPVIGEKVLAARRGLGADPGAYLTTTPGPGRFPLVAGGHPAPLVVSSSDYPGVIRVVNDLQADIKAVTGAEPAVSADQIPAQPEIVLIGTIGKSPLIDDLVSAGKLDVTGIAGQWETSLEQVVENPLPGVRSAFVIAGSDQRGTIYARLRCLERDGGVPLVLVGRRSAGACGRALCPARAPHPGHTGGEVPRLLHQRRESKPRYLGTRLLRFRPSCRVPGRVQQQVLLEDLRDHAAAQGELPVAGGLGKSVRRGRSAEPCDGQGLRHRDGDLARGADDARHRGVEPACCPGRPGQQREHHHARTRPLWRHRRVEFPAQRRCDQGVLDGRHPPAGGPGFRGRRHPGHARQWRYQPPGRQRHRPDEEHHRQRAATSWPASRVRI